MFLNHRPINRSQPPPSGGSSSLCFCRWSSWRFSMASDGHEELTERIIHKQESNLTFFYTNQRTQKTTKQQNPIPLSDAGPFSAPLQKHHLHRFEPSLGFAGLRWPDVHGALSLEDVGPRFRGFGDGQRLVEVGNPVLICRILSWPVKGCNCMVRFLGVNSGVVWFCMGLWWFRVILCCFLWCFFLVWVGFVRLMTNFCWSFSGGSFHSSCLWWFFRVIF